MGRIPTHPTIHWRREAHHSSSSAEVCKVASVYRLPVLVRVDNRAHLAARLAKHDCVFQRQAVDDELEQLRW